MYFSFLVLLGGKKTTKLQTKIGLTIMSARNFCVKFSLLLNPRFLCTPFLYKSRFSWADPTEAEADSLRQRDDFVTASLLVISPGSDGYSSLGPFFLFISKTFVFLWVIADSVLFHSLNALYRRTIPRFIVVNSNRSENRPLIYAV
jgi:hypothetical protein